jgi:hypothetical protein
MRRTILSTLAGGLMLAGAAAPAAAEIVKSSDAGFITRDVAYVEADLTQTWLALITPSKWWSSQHTWSADAANLSLTPQAGGCFCEKIPEVDEPGRFTLEGSVEHMRVIQAYPESALRMVGALGPLQSEPVTGVLTIALTAIDTPDGPVTRIVWEYNVGGSMRYEVPVISKAVDGVMSLQLAGLANMLGRAPVPQSERAPKPERAPEPADDEAPAAIKPENTLPSASDASRSPLPSVDEAFGDLSEEGGSR